MTGATYRLQLTQDFTLTDAADLVDYLAALGVGSVYLSPILACTPGSTHGYDVVDHRRVDEARGGRHGLEVLAARCAAVGLEIVVDIVPNHMGVAVPAVNEAWWDVLKFGRASGYAHWFDIEWSHRSRVLIPVLGDDADLGRDLRLDADRLCYYEHEYPISPGTAGGSPSEVHDRQHYELVNFRRADTDQNYRRFFAVTELAGLRVEDTSVFHDTHRELARWVSAYGITGVRVDHPDGLVDPGQYLQRLRRLFPDAWITVEKILEPAEHLPRSWPVDGMTGYDALAELNAVLLDPAAEPVMTAMYQDLTGDRRTFEQHVQDGKRHVAGTMLQAEINRLARLVPEVENAVTALRELVIAFPVYRSYLPLGREYLEQAVAIAVSRRPELASAVEGLLPRLIDPADELCARFQQVTGAVMAKGVEDTAYYRFNRFVGLNEVGGYPGHFGCTVAEFHAGQQRRLAQAPEAMTTLSTHDTKRGEDIRARLAVLAELSDDWRALAGELLQVAAVPNAAFGYLLWQTIVATGFIDRDRQHAYAEKAMREAAEGTGWIDPDLDFEAAVHAAIDRAYETAPIRAAIEAFSRRLDGPGWSNSLSQKLIQLTMPGRPDVYQGTELWEDSLVDPDNRRPVDFTVRRQLLAELGTSGSREDWARGAAKLRVVHQGLLARRDRGELFTGYRPLTTTPDHNRHLLAFDRGGAITIATRLPVALAAAGGWGASPLELGPRRYVDALTGRSHKGVVALGDVLDAYPVALLLAQDE